MTLTTKQIANKINKGLEKGDTIAHVEECVPTNVDRIYVSFYECLDAHSKPKDDDCSFEKCIFQQSEEYVKFLLNSIGVPASVELDCEPYDENTLWVYGDIVIG